MISGHRVHQIFPDTAVSSAVASLLGYRKFQIKVLQTSEMEADENKIQSGWCPALMTVMLVTYILSVMQESQH